MQSIRAWKEEQDSAHLTHCSPARKTSMGLVLIQQMGIDKVTVALMGTCEGLVFSEQVTDGLRHGGCLAIC